MVRVGWLPTWWQRVQPLMLLIHSAWSVMPGAMPLPCGPVPGNSPARGQVDHRQPVVARITLRGVLRRARDDRRELHVLLPRLDADRLAVGEAVAAHPQVELRRRQLGQHEAALIVGDDDLPQLRREILRLGNHPHAGLGSVAAGHHARDEAGVLGGGHLDARCPRRQTRRPLPPPPRRLPVVLPCSAYDPRETLLYQKLSRTLRSRRSEVGSTATAVASVTFDTRQRRRLRALCGRAAGSTSNPTW